MNMHVRRAIGAATPTIALAFAVSSPFGSTARAAEGDAEPRAESHAHAPKTDAEIELPAEVRALLEEPAAPASPTEPIDRAPPGRGGWHAPAPSVEAGPPLRPVRPGPQGSSLDTSDDADPFVATSVGGLITSGALAALGIGLLVDGGTERICGRLAGCVEAHSPSDPTREGAGYGLIGASVGASVTGGLSLLIALATRPEPGRSRDSPAQGTVGLGLVVGGGALLGAGIGAGVAGDSRVNGDAVPAFVAAGLVSGGLGTILLLARSPDEVTVQRGASSLVPAVAVGLGTAGAVWSF